MSDCAIGGLGGHEEKAGSGECHLHERMTLLAWRGVAWDTLRRACGGILAPVVFPLIVGHARADTTVTSFSSKGHRTFMMTGAIESAVILCRRRRITISSLVTPFQGQQGKGRGFIVASQAKASTLREAESSDALRLNQGWILRHVVLAHLPLILLHLCDRGVVALSCVELSTSKSTTASKTIKKGRKR